MLEPRAHRAHPARARWPTRSAASATAASTVDDEALEALAASVGGDARIALNALEAAVACARRSRTTKRPHVTQRRRRGGAAAPHVPVRPAGRRPLRHDLGVHQVAARLRPGRRALLAGAHDRGGEDPLFIVRRMVILASEDVGLADPMAMLVATACQQAVHFIGMPEGFFPMAECALYLALAPKSNSVGGAYGAAMRDVETTPQRPGAAAPAQRRHRPDARRWATAAATSTRTTTKAASSSSSTSPTARRPHVLPRRRTRLGGPAQARAGGRRREAGRRRERRRRDGVGVIRCRCTLVARLIARQFRESTRGAEPIVAATAENVAGNTSYVAALASPIVRYLAAPLLSQSCSVCRGPNIVTRPATACIAANGTTSGGSLHSSKACERMAGRYDWLSSLRTRSGLRLVRRQRTLPDTARTARSCFEWTCG